MQNECRCEVHPSRPRGTPDVDEETSMKARSWKDPRNGVRWTVELHTSRWEGKEKRPAFWLRFNGSRVNRVLPLPGAQDLDTISDDQLELMLDEAHPNPLGTAVSYHVSPYPEEVDSSWVARASVFYSNESEAWQELVSDPEVTRFATYEDAARRSRALGEAYIKRRFRR
jgi:hypothetical protein